MDNRLEDETTRPYLRRALGLAPIKGKSMGANSFNGR